MARLREPVYGCPWDRRQTHETILPFTLEEAYEVADAILKGDPRHLRVRGAGRPDVSGGVLRPDGGRSR